MGTCKAEASYAEPNGRGCFAAKENVQNALIIRSYSACGPIQNQTTVSFSLKRSARHPSPTRIEYVGYLRPTRLNARLG